MHVNNIYWIVLLCMVLNESVFSKTIKYHNHHDAIDSQSNGFQKEKRNAALIGLGVLSVGISIYQETSKCKNEAPTLYDNVKKFEELQEQYESLRSQTNIDWNGVVDVRGYVQRIEASSKILANQLKDFFGEQYSILAALDPDFDAKINKIDEELKKKFSKALEVPYSDIELGYHTALDFPMKLLATTAELLGTSVHTISHQMQHALKISFSPYIKGSDIMIVKGNVKLAKVNNFFGPSDTVQKKLSMKNSLATTKLIGKAVSGVWVLATAANVFWQVWSYEKKCDKYEEEARKAVEKISETVATLKQIRIDVEELKQNATNVYNVYVEILKSDEVKESINAVVSYVSGSNFDVTTKASLLNTLNDYLATIGSSSKSMPEREKLLNELTNVIMVKVLKNCKCVTEKLKVVEKMRTSCISGVSTLDKLYTSAKNAYDSSTYKCNDLQPLVKDDVLKSVKENLVLFNKTENCASNSKGFTALVCSMIRNGEEAIALELGVSTTVVKEILSTCVSVSVPLPSGKIEICAAKANNGAITDVTKAFNFWLTNEIENIYSRCALNDNQKKIICNKKYESISINSIQIEFGNYDPTDVHTAYHSCTALTSVTKFDKQIICTLKSANLTIEHADFVNFRNKYSGSELLQKTYDNCS